MEGDRRAKDDGNNNNNNGRASIPEKKRRRRKSTAMKPDRKRASDPAHSPKRRRWLPRRRRRPRARPRRAAALLTTTTLVASAVAVAVVGGRSAFIQRSPMRHSASRAPGAALALAFSSSLPSYSHSYSYRAGGLQSHGYRRSETNRGWNLSSHSGQLISDSEKDLSRGRNRDSADSDDAENRSPPRHDAKSQAPRPQQQQQQRDRFQPPISPPLRSKRDRRRSESIKSGRNPLLSLNLNLDALASSSLSSSSGSDAATSSPPDGSASSTSSNGELAEELYLRISALYKEGYYAVPPDVVSFNSVLKAWRDDPIRALEFWEHELVPRVEDDIPDEADVDGQNGAPLEDPSWRTTRDTLRRRRAPLLEPNVRSYNTFLWALARAGMHRQAEMLMESMKHPQSLVWPDRITYNTVLLSYYNARTMKTPESDTDDDLDHLPVRSLRLLDEMIASPHLKPDAVTFNTVLAVMATVGTQEAALRAEEMLRRMETCGVRPDVYTYAAVIQAWAAAGDGDVEEASKRAMAVFEEMKRSGVPPNAVTYTLVMQSLCRSNQPRAATSLLNEMVHHALKEEAATSTSGDVPREVSEAPRPDAVAFSALIDGWARWMKYQAAQGSPQERKQASNEAVRAVLGLLAQMKELSREWPDVAPNERTYTSVLATVARSRHPASGLRAERLLEDMERSGLVATTVHWNAVLDAHAKCPRSDKVRMARTAWAKMARAKVAPDVVTYNTLLAAAASTRSDVEDEVRRECVRTGLQALALLQRDPNVRPTSLTFHYVFKILGRFLPAAPSLRTREEGATDPRRSVIRAAFRLCCDSGCLNAELLRQLREHVFATSDDDEGEEERWILEGQVSDWRPNMAVSDLPPSWSCRSQRLS